MSFRSRLRTTSRGVTPTKRLLFNKEWCLECSTVGNVNISKKIGPNCLYSYTLIKLQVEWRMHSKGDALTQLIVMIILRSHGSDRHLSLMQYVVKGVKGLCSIALSLYHINCFTISLQLEFAVSKQDFDSLNIR